MVSHLPGSLGRNRAVAQQRRRSLNPSGDAARSAAFQDPTRLTTLLKAWSRAVCASALAAACAVLIARNGGERSRVPVGLCGGAPRSRADCWVVRMIASDVQTVRLVLMMAFVHRPSRVASMLALA